MLHTNSYTATHTAHSFIQTDTQQHSNIATQPTTRQLQGCSRRTDTRRPSITATTAAHNRTDNQLLTQNSYTAAHSRTTTGLLIDRLHGCSQGQLQGSLQNSYTTTPSRTAADHKKPLHSCSYNSYIATNSRTATQQLLTEGQLHSYFYQKNIYEQLQADEM